MDHNMMRSDAPQFPLRPTGHELSEYGDYESWSDERWAWEFLRRNYKYQKWCCEVERDNLSKEESDEIAITQFGLMAYKHFREPFTTQGGKRPKFTTRNIQTLSRVTQEQEAKFCRRSISPLRPGEVLIKFNVGATEWSDRAINRQIRAASDYLHKLERRWRQEHRINTPERRIKVNGLIELLRLLDIVDYNDKFSPPEAKKKRVDLYRVIFPRLLRLEKGRPIHKPQFQQAFQDKMAIAKKYAEIYYLELAAVQPLERPNIESTVWQ